MKTAWLKWICAFMVAITWNLAAADPAWPARAITWIQPYAPGTATDSSARYVAQQLGEKWNVAIVMDHRAGANGLIGTEAAARAAPDGYTFMLTAIGFFTNEAMVENLPYDPLKSFLPVAKVGAVQLLLVVPSTSPFNTVQELVDFARTHPGKLSYASGGNGSSQHLAGSMLSTLTGVKLLHVPYKSQVPAAVATSTGEVDFSFAAITTARPLLAAKRLKVLASSGSKRSTSFPEIPTLEEAGVRGYAYEANTFLFAPAKTPLPIVQSMSDAVGVVAHSAGFKDFCASIGIEPEFTGHAEWVPQIAAERTRWLQLVRASGAKAE